MRYPAMLRGINAGRLVRVSMKQLKEIFQSAGSANVEAPRYSGNVVFEARYTSSEFRGLIEERIGLSCGEPVPVLAKTAEEMIAILGFFSVDWVGRGNEQTYDSRQAPG